VPTDAGKVLVNTGSTSYIKFQNAFLMTTDRTLIKDIGGTSDTNKINILFAGSEKCDNDPTIVIGNRYGYVGISPVFGGGAWYRS
jgi:hypothetical protein